VIARWTGNSLPSATPSYWGSVGGFTSALQGQYHVYDGVGILGFSAFHTQPPSRPGTPPLASPWTTRSGDARQPLVINATALANGSSQQPLGLRMGDGEHPLAWAFHYEDVPREIVAADLAAYDGGPLQVWRSATTPACVGLGATPGVVTTEAAAITVPVLVAMGEGDVVPDPWLEPKAYRSAKDISLFVCPRMGHMHNFAGTRVRFWQRIHAWGEMVAQGGSVPTQSPNGGWYSSGWRWHRTPGGAPPTLTGDRFRCLRELPMILGRGPWQARARPGTSVEPVLGPGRTRMRRVIGSVSSAWTAWVPGSSDCFSEAFRRHHIRVETATEGSATRATS
jgi:hypothetical protein